MNTLRKLWHAIENVAVSLEGLAATVDAFSQEIGQRTGIRTDAALPLLTEGNGATEPAPLLSARKRRAGP